MRLGKRHVLLLAGRGCPDVIDIKRTRRDGAPLGDHEERGTLADTVRVDLEEIELKVSSSDDRIGGGEFPLVYVVEEDSEEDRFVWDLQHQNIPRAQKA